MAAVKAAPAVPPLEVRNSKVHGSGVFATRQIRKGEEPPIATRWRITLSIDGEPKPSGGLLRVRFAIG